MIQVEILSTTVVLCLLTVDDLTKNGFKQAKQHHKL